MSIKNVIVISVDDAQDSLALAQVIAKIVGTLAGGEVLSGDVTMVSGHKLKEDNDLSDQLEKLWQAMVERAEQCEQESLSNVVPITNAIN